jgi:hypothetical protein
MGPIPQAIQNPTINEITDNFVSEMNQKFSSTIIISFVSASQKALSVFNKLFDTFR